MKRLICILTAVLMLLFCVTAHADFGDYAGDNDFGGYDSDYDYDYDDDYDYDYDDDDSYGGFIYSGGDDEFTPTEIVITVVIIAAIIAALIFFNRKTKNIRGKMIANAGARPTDASTLRSMAEYTNLDPGFSETEFKEKISNMYVQFQNAWQNKDMEELRPYLTEGLYARCERQLEEYKRNGQTNKIERIAVLDVAPVGWTQQDNNDIIVVKLKTRIVDYVVNDADGSIVRGSATAEKFMEYEWSLARTSGKTSADFSGTVAHSCPNCGAPIDLNQSARCEFCDSVVETDTFNWAVREIRGISQRTVM